MINLQFDYKKGIGRANVIFSLFLGSVLCVLHEDGKMEKRTVLGKIPCCVLTGLLPKQTGKNTRVEENCHEVS